MVSPWQTPLPHGGYTMSRVVVYLYSGRWIPIMFCSLIEAISLYRQALQTGKEVYVFPFDADPWDF
jgi:hypothetical protein